MPPKVVFESVGYYLPDCVVTSDEVQDRVYETTRFQIPRGLVERVTGIQTRHYSSNGDQASDLAARAAKVALDRAGMNPEDVEVLIFAACMQDIAEPATANILQEKLGAMQAHVFDVKNACNSFLNGLDVADSLIRCGKAKNALIASGETLSYFIDWRIDTMKKLRTGMSGLTLGDAGAAAIVRAETNGNGRGILPSVFRSYGDQWRLATVLSGGSMYKADSERAFFSSHSPELRDQAIKYIPMYVKECLDRVGWTAAEVDLVCTHQVTADLVDDLAELCGIDPGKCVISVVDCGNTASASIPIGITRAVEANRLQPHAKVLLVGGAAGFSVGVVPIVW